MNYELLHESFAEFNVYSELNNYLKKAVWSSVGDKVATISEDKSIRIFPIPSKTFCTVWYDSDPTGFASSLLSCSRSIKEQNHIYDLSIFNKGGICGKDFVFSSCKSVPIHLWDAENLQFIGSYQAKNHVDEHVSAICIHVNSYLNEILAGYDGFLQIFDIENPAHEVRKLLIKDSLTEKNVKTIVSALAASVANPTQYAYGCYNKMIYLGDTRSTSPTLTLSGHNGGITHMKYSLNGYNLFSGARKDNNILVWDLRSPAKPLVKYFMRDSNTNQRMIFDINEFGTVLAAGCCNGQVLLFDVTKNSYIETLSAHYDSVVSVQFSPISPNLILTASGQRHYEIKSTEGLEMSEDETEPTNKQYRNGVRIWRINY